MKLVRDNIPEIILNSKRKAIYHTARQQEYKKLLREKLLEEVKEFLEQESIEEIADILEVLEYIAKSYQYNWMEVLKAKELKKQQNGGFDKMLVLTKIEQL